jgi:predicted PurR-regulated permease PerM
MKQSECIMNNVNENKSIDRLIRIGLLVLLTAMSLMILAPFIIILIWGVIIAVALFPLFKKSVKALANKKTLTAVLFTFTGLTVIIIPSIMLAESSASGYQNLQQAFEEGRLTIPPPTENVNEWPLIGEQLYNFWSLASHNLPELFEKYSGQHSEQVKELVRWLLETLTGLGLTILQFMVSLVIAGVLLAKADLGANTTRKFAKRLVGDNAEEFVSLTSGTIRSVVQGILGIALIQALASAILLIIFNVPVPGLWALFVLIMAIVQLPPLLILGPISIYIFSVMDTVPATVFAVFALLISISDSFLKPLFLGRGVDIPMLVVLLGAIGGMLAFGILGLFVGAVVLALSYKLMMAWLHVDNTTV